MYLAKSNSPFPRPTMAWGLSDAALNRRWERSSRPHFTANFTRQPYMTSARKTGNEELVESPMICCDPRNRNPRFPPWNPPVRDRASLTTAQCQSPAARGFAPHSKLRALSGVMPSARMSSYKSQARLSKSQVAKTCEESGPLEC